MPQKRLKLAAGGVGPGSLHLNSAVNLPCHCCGALTRDLIISPFVFRSTICFCRLTGHLSRGIDVVQTPWTTSSWMTMMRARMMTMTVQLQRIRCLGLCSACGRSLGATHHQPLLMHGYFGDHWSNRLQNRCQSCQRRLLQTFNDSLPLGILIGFLKFAVCREDNTLAVPFAAFCCGLLHDLMGAPLDECASSLHGICD